MDPSHVRVTPPIEDDDEWDTDGFVIPSLGIEDIEPRRSESPEVETKSSSPKEEKIYLGPHGAPPSHSKLQQQQQEQSASGRKQRFKQKLKEADERIRGTGHENKLENIRQLVGSQKISPVTTTMSKGSTRDWLDPHCHESQFERRNPH
ncbi:uncharacterized protein LOC124940021 [Impatiens glandulifera]|uniref:uncharacterized protein LOC124940021 n=1 Tax=Impatiens glandulifera TaxID=253017 RepID=UPI001FB189D6|nr:uncharacterized protein LOC124940021 [Impatiens glandulifera]